MCGSFTCSKNSLIALNFLYVLVSLVLIGVAGAARYTAVVTSLSVVGGIIACGVFLLILSVVGLVAASRHHQVLLFCYMIFLFLIFVIQFSVACACLVINTDQQELVAAHGWRSAPDDLRQKAQHQFGCCGFNSLTPNDTSLEHPSCMEVQTADASSTCCPGETNSTECCASDDTCKCPLCGPLLVQAMSDGFSAVGGVGLFFSFTELMGFLIARTYRHQVDPRANIQSLLQRQ